MAKRRRTQSRDAREETFAEPQQARPPRRLRRLKRGLVFLLLLVVGLVAAAPTIVSSTSLHNTLLKRAMPAGWQIESEQAALGWASEQSLRGVKITDGEGKPLLTLESLTLPRSLMSLALDQTDLGRVELVRPTAYVELRPGGSNWEEFIAALQSQAQPDADDGNLPSIELEVVDGTVRGFDSVTQQQWTLSEANVSASVGETMSANGSARLATEGRPQAGQVQFRWQPSDGGQQQLELLADNLPLEPLEPLLARVAPGGELAGTLSADAKLNWLVDERSGLFLETNGRLEARQFDFSVAALAGDRLQSQRLVAPWKLRVTGGEMTVEQLAINSDWAELAVRGSTTLAELQALSLANLPRPQTRLSGKVDLAKVAAMLPNTLQLRRGVRIDGGELQFDFAGKAGAERPSWQATASMQNVVGSDGRRQIRWEEPIHLVVDLQQTSVGVQVEQLALTAPFAKAEVQTQSNVVEGEFEVNLNRLSRELGQFVDLQAWQLRGLGEGTFKLTRQAGAQFVAEAKVDLTDLHVAQLNQVLWTDPKLHVELQATGSEQDLQPVAIRSGEAKLSGPRDAFALKLLAPIDFRDSQQVWRVLVEGNGPLDSWSGRLRPWVASMPQQLAGDAQLRAEVDVAADAVHVKSSQGSVVGLRVVNNSVRIDEPRVEFSGDARWDRRTGSLVASQMQLMGSSLSFRAREVAVALAAAGVPTARGSVAFRADLERVAAMAGLVGQSTSTWPRGKAAGQVQLSSDAQQLQADFSMRADQLEVVRMTAAAGAVYGRPEILWKEPQLEVTGKVKYLLANDRAELEQLQVRGQTLQLNSSAKVESVSGAGLLEASGLVEYDPQELAKLVESYGGEGVKLQGDRQVRFQVAGPLFASASQEAQQWQMTAEAGWSSASVYGLLLSGGKLQGSMSGGQVQIAPLDVGVGQGRLTASPYVSLLPGTEQVILPRGPLVTNVSISPEVSETMLKYVAPILAGATRAEGQFSVDLEQTQIPLDKPEQARVQGRLAVHRLNVSPGPMVNQLATLVDQVEALTKRQQFLQASTAPSSKTILTMPERQIDFQVVEGRVYHRNLEFLIDDVPVRSQGSVGFDQTLSLLIEIPIQDKWVQREKALRPFAGQSLKLPIYGTFQKPRIDQRAIADLSTKLLQGAATKAIDDELKRQFEKLFK